MQSVVKEQGTLLNRALPVLVRVVINLIVVVILIAVIVRLLRNFV